MFLLDLHCHTSEHSFDGKVSASVIVRGLMERGFHGVAFTDHNYVWSAEELEGLREKCGLGEDFVLLSGQEVRTADQSGVVGDLLVFGLTRNLEDGINPLEVLALLKNCGGFALAAHPGVDRIGLGGDLGNYPVAAAEVWNGRYGNRNAVKARELADRFGVAEFGGSDAHREADIGGGGTLFPTLPRSLGELKDLLEAGLGEAWKPGMAERLKRRYQGIWGGLRGGSGESES